MFQSMQDWQYALLVLVVILALLIPYFKERRHYEEIREENRRKMLHVIQIIDHEAKNATAGHEIAKCQFQPESAPASAPSSPRSPNTQKTMAKMVAST